MKKKQTSARTPRGLAPPTVMAPPPETGMGPPPGVNPGVVPAMAMASPVRRRGIGLGQGKKRKKFTQGQY